MLIHLTYQKISGCLLLKFSKNTYDFSYKTISESNYANTNIVELNRFFNDPRQRINLVENKHKWKTEWAGYYFYKYEIWIAHTTKNVYKHPPLVTRTIGACKHYVGLGYVRTRRY